MNFSNLPNAITIARLFLVPWLVVMLKQENYQAALIIFFVGGISDGIDGYLARRYNLMTHLGAVLDPLADKLLMVSTFIMLTILGDVPFWLMVAVVSRDMLIVGGYLTVTSIVGPVKMRPSVLSKINTVVQILLVLSILLQRSYSMTVPMLDQVMFIAVLVTTTLSGLHYLWIWLVQREITPVNEKNNKAD